MSSDNKQKSNWVGVMNLLQLILIAVVIYLQVKLAFLLWGAQP